MEAYLISDGFTPASAKAGGPDQTAPEKVRSTSPPIWPFGASPAPGNLRIDDDQRAAAITDHATIQEVQRIGDHRRIHNVLNSHDVAQHCIRVMLGMVR